jgi:AcrR family transcriptional regulator
VRRLGHALGRDPMSLYRYAANKTDLLDGVDELVLEQLTVDTTDDNWAEQLRTVAHTFRRLALAHPHEATLKLLTRGGFSDVDALYIYRSFFGFLHGHVLTELQELVENPEETDDLLRLGLYRLPLREFASPRPRRRPGQL